jgi:hypothetical protein
MWTDGAVLDGDSEPAYARSFVRLPGKTTWNPSHPAVPCDGPDMKADAMRLRLGGPRRTTKMRASSLPSLAAVKTPLPLRSRTNCRAIIGQRK